MKDFNKGGSRPNFLGLENLTIGNIQKLVTAYLPSNNINPQSNVSRGHSVSQQNSITIVAHNIEDLEHKFIKFLEKSLDVATRQVQTSH